MISDLYTRQKELQKSMESGDLSKEPWIKLFEDSIKSLQNVLGSDESLKQMAEILARSIVFTPAEVVENTKSLEEMVKVCLLLSSKNTFLNTGRSRMDYLSSLLKFFVYKTSEQEQKRVFNLYQDPIDRSRCLTLMDLSKGRF